MRLGLIGKSLSHSFSKSYFENKFENLKLSDYSYDNLEFESEESIIQTFEKLKETYLGLNVTIPYKKAVMSALDEIDDVAKKISAVNCIHFQNGKSIGYNTDYLGFYKSIFSFSLHSSNSALIIGNGGSSHAIQYVLKEILHMDIDILDRSQPTRWADRSKMDLSNYSIIVNTTPIGMYPHSLDDIHLHYSSLRAQTLCVDLIYNPEMTVFLQNAKNYGAQILNGQKMLEIQAEESWKIWLSSS